MESERPRPFADDWKYKNPSQLSFAQKKIIQRGILNPSSKEHDYPKNKGKVPVFLEWEQHIYMLPYLLIPIAARGLYMYFTGLPANPIVTYILTVFFNANFIRGYFKRLKSYTLKVGFLDGEVGRDAIPEAMTGKLFKEIVTALFGRPLVVFLLSYDPYAFPKLDWWLPLQLGIFTVIADFIYYWMHRATHEVPVLWKLHQRHHTTKHPSSYLLGFADQPQEIFDVFATPLLTYAIYPISFDAFYLWSMYFIAGEIVAHTGLRAYYPGPLVSVSVPMD